MMIMNFLLSYWDSVLIVAAVIGSFVYLIAKKQYAILDRIIFALVTEAEKKYGSGTGAVKLAAVIEWVYPKIPAVARLFITESQLVQIIERVLSEAKARWGSNPNISTYLGSADVQ